MLNGFDGFEAIKFKCGCHAKICRLCSMVTENKMDKQILTTTREKIRTTKAKSERVMIQSGSGGRKKRQKV